MSRRYPVAAREYRNSESEESDDGQEVQKLAVDCSDLLAACTQHIDYYLEDHAEDRTSFVEACSALMAMAERLGYRGKDLQVFGRELEILSQEARYLSPLALRLRIRGMLMYFGVIPFRKFS